MRLVSHRIDNEARSGVLHDGRVYATGELAQRGGLGSGPWRTTRDVLRAGPEAWARLAEIVATAGGEVPSSALEDCRLGPPVGDPEKIICLGLNYHDHAIEIGLQPPAIPMLFAKFANSLVGPLDDIVVPAVAAAAVDYEAELAVVIGRSCRNVEVADALGHVAGVMALNDVSARDLQRETSQWLGGKALDTFAPCGPALVMLDEVPDVQALRLRTRVNGVVLQDGSTADMVHRVAETIAFLSRRMTLVPGDIIATGTPAGVGDSREPKIRLVPGDVVEVEIDGVGVLRNLVVEGD